MNIRWFLALTLGCIVCLEWTLCEAAGAKDRTSSGLAEPAKPRSRKPSGRGRKLKLHLKKDEEINGIRRYRETPSKKQPPRRKKCVCPPCEQCPVCPVCKETHPPDTVYTTAIPPKDDIAAVTQEPTTQPTSTTSTTTTTTTTEATTTTTTKAPTTTTKTTRRPTTKSPLGLLISNVGNVGNIFSFLSKNHDKHSGGGLLGGISFPNPFRNVIKIFSRVSDLKRKIQKRLPDPFGLRTTKPTTKKCTTKNGSGKSDESSKPPDGKHVACNKVIELKHPGKIYICME